MSTDQLLVGKGNEGQAEAWDGDEGAQWAANPEFFDGSIRRQHARLLDAAHIVSTDCVLDIGCGNGLTTRDAARAAASGGALGVDLSSQMIERARSLTESEGLTNAHFVQADAQVHPFEPEDYDVAISRFGSMFFGNQVAAFKNIRRALRSGGRLVLISWQGPQGNEWLTSFGRALTLGRGMPTPPPDAQGPFAHANPDYVTQLLHDAGYDEIAIDAVEEPLYFGTNADEAYPVMSELLAWMMQVARRSR